MQNHTMNDLLFFSMRFPIAALLLFIERSSPFVNGDFFELNSSALHSPLINFHQETEQNS